MLYDILHTNATGSVLSVKLQLPTNIPCERLKLHLVILGPQLISAVAQHKRLKTA